MIRGIKQIWGLHMKSKLSHAKAGGRLRTIYLASMPDTED